MSIFSREWSAEYVPAFAARLLLAMGKGIAAGPDELRSALGAEAEGVWTLALIAVRWYGGVRSAAEAQIVAALLPDSELLPMLSNLDAFRDLLLPVVKTAHEAQNEAHLATAGVYFVTAAQQMGVPLLSAVIRSEPVAQVGVRLRRRFPLQPEVRAAYERVLRGQAAAMGKPAATLRGPSARFAQGDLSPRRRPAQVLAQRVVAPPVVEKPPLPVVLLPPEPQPSAAEVTRTYLLGLKWQADEVERLLAGPSRSFVPGAVPWAAGASHQLRER